MGLTRQKLPQLVYQRIFCRFIASTCRHSRPLRPVWCSACALSPFKFEWPFIASNRFIGICPGPQLIIDQSPIKMQFLVPFFPPRFTRSNKTPHPAWLINFRWTKTPSYWKQLHFGFNLDLSQSSFPMASFHREVAVRYSYRSNRSRQLGSFNNFMKQLHVEW